MEGTSAIFVDLVYINVEIYVSAPAVLRYSALAPYRPQDCKNGPSLFSGQTSYKVTKPGFSLLTAVSKLWKGLFLVLSVCGFLFVYEISCEPLNEFAPNSHGRRIWSIARTSLKVKVTWDKKTAFFSPLGACVWFMFGKTSLASSLFCVIMSFGLLVQFLSAFVVLGLVSSLFSTVLNYWLEKTCKK